jgi:hypothetical protein
MDKNSDERQKAMNFVSNNLVFHPVLDKLPLISQYMIQGLFGDK